MEQNTRPKPTANHIIRGAISGFIATIPMTYVMKGMQRRIDRREREPLPPAQITERVLEKAQIKEDLHPETRKDLTLVSHFAFGSGMGALFGVIPKLKRLPLPVQGPAFGLLVWTGSYLGWLPAAGIFPSATQKPASQNLLMIASHVVWGGALGASLSLLRRPASRSA